MFMLYALFLGLAVGLLAGGRPAGLLRLSFRLAPVAVAALVLQGVLFLPAVAARVGGLGVPLYLLSNALVLVAILANVRLTGVPLIALGAALNLLVIAANGGYMPADAAAYAARNLVIEGYANTRVIEHPVLAPLSDWIALPAWLPLSNVISAGDVLIGAGTVVLIAAAMRRGRVGAAAAA